MSELLEFTREEWADKPYLIELRGGPFNGKRHHWHSLPAMWRQPEPAPAIPYTVEATASPRA